MKAIKKFIVLAAAAIGLSSCVGDLDLKPTSEHSPRQTSQKIPRAIWTA